MSNLAAVSFTNIWRLSVSDEGKDIENLAGGKR